MLPIQFSTFIAGPSVAGPGQSQEPQQEQQPLQQGRPQQQPQQQLHDQHQQLQQLQQLQLQLQQQQQQQQSTSLSSHFLAQSQSAQQGGFFPDYSAYALLGAAPQSSAADQFGRMAPYLQSQQLPPLQQLPLGFTGQYVSSYFHASQPSPFQAEQPPSTAPFFASRAPVQALPSQGLSINLPQQQQLFQVPQPVPPPLPSPMHRYVQQPDVGLVYAASQRAPPSSAYQPVNVATLLTMAGGSGEGYSRGGQGGVIQYTFRDPASIGRTALLQGQHIVHHQPFTAALAGTHSMAPAGVDPAPSAPRQTEEQQLVTLDPGAGAAQPTPLQRAMPQSGPDQQRHPRFPRFSIVPFVRGTASPNQSQPFAEGNRQMVMVVSMDDTDEVVLLNLYDNQMTRYYEVPLSAVHMSRCLKTYADYTMSVGKRSKYRFQVCNNFLQSRCRQAENCSYMHITSADLPTGREIHMLKKLWVSDGGHSSDGNMGSSHEITAAGEPASSALGSGAATLFGNTYQMLPRGREVRVNSPHGRNSTMVPMENIVVTNGSRRLYQTLTGQHTNPPDATAPLPHAESAVVSTAEGAGGGVVSGAEAALGGEDATPHAMMRSVSRSPRTDSPPRHCAHFQFRKFCNRGSECKYIHAKFRCLPLPSDASTPQNQTHPLH